MNSQRSSHWRRRVSFQRILPIFSLFLSQNSYCDAYNNVWRAYNTALNAHPIPTKSISGLVLAIAGDVCAQCADEVRRSSAIMSVSQGNVSNKYGNRRLGSKYQSLVTKSQSNNLENISRWDYKRTIGFGAFGAIVSLVWHYLLPILYDICPYSAAMRLCIWQGTVIPFFYYPMFYICTGFIRGQNFTEALDNMKRNYFVTYRRGLCFWGPTQYLQFKIIPLEWQVVYVSILGFVWNFILSLTAMQKASTKGAGTSLLKIVEQ